MVERKTTEEILEIVDSFEINEISSEPYSNSQEEFLDKVWLSEEGVKEALALVSERSEAEAESNGHESAVAQLQEELFGVDEE